jgi:hypothetical protein
LRVEAVSHFADAPSNEIVFAAAACSALHAIRFWQNYSASAHELRPVDLREWRFPFQEPLYQTGHLQPVYVRSVWPRGILRLSSPSSGWSFGPSKHSRVWRRKRSEHKTSIFCVAHK